LRDKPPLLEEKSLVRPSLQLRVEEIHDAGLAAETQERFADHVGAEEGEEIKRLACLEEGFGKLDGMLEVNVVVGQAVDEQERAA
jgi:hypothetical protein